jgi:hypothetical protein
MNRWVYLSGVILVFALGFYAGQKHSESALLAQAGFDNKIAAPVKDPHSLRGHVRHNGLSPAPVMLSAATPGVPSGGLPPPPHDPTEGLAPVQPSLEDIARQEHLNAEMIASMRANHLPQEHIALMEQAFAAQKETLNAKETEPPAQERSAAELAADLRESLKQADAPSAIIEEMVEHMHPSKPDNDVVETEPEPPQDQPPPP